ncbi:MAG: SUMF1/EgtB/PvdO family nonheme iron enzyme, partial [Brachymonas sp.]|nr:SUMF1/EgtB/PvdO family nonheme iron enzyme [Brachymonas sp.]
MIRTSDAATLGLQLQAVRRTTLSLCDAYEAAGLLDVPCEEQFNLPLWELGHIGWFQQWWIGRNLQRDLGRKADPEHARLPCRVIALPHHGDAWYNSSTVPHAQRWELPLLDSKACKSYLQGTLDQTLALLHEADSGDDALYFYRLVLLHEAMHIEAAIYMAQALQAPIELPAKLLHTMNLIALRAVNTPANALFSFKNRQKFLLGRSAAGFSFDNELGAHEVQLEAFEIDARPVSWAQYLRFVRETGYALPIYLREASQSYEQLVFGKWQPLNLQSSAVHISWHDAQAYCLWAGRRLPSEAEWEYAAIQEPSMSWGDVWEWTASDFVAYPGFEAHPYRDYSEPWLAAEKCCATPAQPHCPIMRNPRYRNYFTPERTDIYA